ncbi:unnamed protein product [Phytomonas sp. Hart1]|nr:unnamed protein product [Phytomonas sp. Hart1]|eukprot:CCW72112.1 unnamed protein product [Phytomonas sp. isolate Hart1]
MITREHRMNSILLFYTNKNNVMQNKGTRKGKPPPTSNRNGVQFYTFTTLSPNFSLR